MIEAKLFTKPFCSDCQKAHIKLDEWKAKYNFQIVEYDLETADGLAEALYYDVFKVPTFMIDNKHIKFEDESTFTKIEEMISKSN